MKSDNPIVGKPGRTHMRQHTVANLHTKMREIKCMMKNTSDTELRKQGFTLIFKHKVKKEDYYGRKPQVQMGLHMLPTQR